MATVQNFTVVREVKYEHLIRIEITGMPDNLPRWAKRYIRSRHNWRNHVKDCTFDSDGELVINGKRFRKPGPQ